MCSTWGGRLVPSPELRDAPVRLASPEELAVAARDAPATARLEAFVDWVSRSRCVDEDADRKPLER